MPWSFKNIAVRKELEILRPDKLRQRMADHGIQGMLVTSAPNIFYLSGFTGTSAVLFITGEHNYLLTDFRYAEQARQQALGYEIIRADKDALREVNQLSGGITAIGIEEQSVSLAEYRQMEQIFSGKALRETSSMLQEMRQVKDLREIEILKNAVKITDQAYETILGKIKPGVTENEISIELEYTLRKFGASGRSFDYIVASGARSALPHGTATSKKVEKGELLTMDFGAKYQYYCSDFTKPFLSANPKPSTKRFTTWFWKRS